MNVANGEEKGLRGLWAYQAALEFYREARGALQPKAKSHVSDQLLRASESVLLNIAEAYPALGADRARRFRIAADEASECIAALDILEVQGVLGEGKVERLRELLTKTNKMLWKLSRK